MTVSNATLALSRRERRLAYLAARRADKSVRWEPFRRWDGGKPNILASVDLLRIKAANRQARKEAAATGKAPGLLARIRGIRAHRLFRRRAA